MSFDFGYFYTGAVSGATGLLLSHPIDTIKSNVQTNKKIKWTPRYLYRGVLPPLFGMGLEKAIVFGTYQNVLRWLNNNKNHRGGTNQRLNHAMAGASAGLVGSFVVTPVERLKILYQTNTGIKQSINPKFLYRGFFNTLSREMPGFTIYFSVYEELKRSSEQGKLTPFHHFIYGGLSGLTAWAFIYPQDIVKTQIQASDNRTVKEVVKTIYKKNGLRGFFVGAQFALFRAVLLHAGTLSMFEYLDKKVRNLQ